MCVHCTHFPLCRTTSKLRWNVERLQKNSMNFRITLHSCFSIFQSTIEIKSHRKNVTDWSFNNIIVNAFNKQFDSNARFETNKKREIEWQTNRKITRIGTCSHAKLHRFKYFQYISGWKGTERSWKLN